jgi:hypothetical protein
MGTTTGDYGGSSPCPMPTGTGIAAKLPDATRAQRPPPSAAGAAWLALFATPAEQQPIAKHMKAVAFMDGEQITRLHGEENWIEVSGLKADRSFYRKAVLACAGRVWHEVAFEHPTQTQGSISEFVSRAQGCGEQRRSRLRGFGLSDCW